MTNVIKDLVLSDYNDLIASYLSQLNIALEDKNYENVPQTLKKLRDELDKDIARRVYAGKKGGYNTLINLMKSCPNNSTVIRSALKTITSLMTGNPDLLNDEGIALQIQ